MSGATARPSTSALPSSSDPSMTGAVERRQHILDAIAKAGGIAHRDPTGVDLIAVSKTRSAEAIEALIAAGQRSFGESRVQEALAKWPELHSRHPDVLL